MDTASAASAAASEQEKNFEVARRINREARADASSPYAGKYIGVWRGEVVAVGDTLDEIDTLLSELPAPASQEAVWIEASVDYDQTYMIWEVREL